MKGYKGKVEMLEEKLKFSTGDWGPLVDGVFQGVYREPRPGEDTTFRIVDPEEIEHEEGQNDEEL